MLHVYLSPHLDDAALSCGGTIFRQTQAGQPVLVVNIFAGAPDYDQLSAFATEKHAVWGNHEDVMATRRADDGAALAVLGADVAYWEYFDAIYRVDGERVLYGSESGIFGDVDPAERELQEELVARVDAVLEQAGDARCYAPLGIGHHVDHLVVRDVGLSLADRGRWVEFYEDFPYVWRLARGMGASGKGAPSEGVDDVQLASPLPSDLQGLGNWASSVRSIDVELKIAAVACYASQIADLFDSEGAMAEAVREYSRMAGGDCDAERFWRL